MRIVIGMLLLCCLSAAGQNKASLSKLESDRAKVEKEISLLNSKLNKVDRDKSAALGKLSLLKTKISAREKLIASCDQTLGVLNDSIRICQREIDRLQARHDTLSLYYARLIRGAYKNRDSRLWYMFILSSESIGQGLRRAGYLRQMGAQLNEQAMRVRETSAALEKEKQRLGGLKKASEKVRKKEAGERAKLKNEEADASRLVTRLGKDSKKYKKQLQEKNRQKEALNRKIADLIRKEASGKGGGASSGKGKGKTTSTVVDTQLSNEFAANKGRLPWPVEGAIVERFGKHFHPVYAGVELPQNNGVTLAVKTGAQAKAVFNGKVTQIVVLPGYNQCVLVSHGAYFTLYSKLRSVAVKVGEKVSTGQVVGTVDTIGGEDLFHFELWNGSTPQNPEGWLKD